MTRTRASAKAAGANFERVMADFFAAEIDDRIDRRVKTGSADKGDLGGMRIGKHRVVVECKNTSRINLAGWYAEAEAEAINDGAEFKFVTFKRHGVSDPARQWVLMSAADVALLIREANR